MVGGNPGFIKVPQGTFQEMRILSVNEKKKHCTKRGNENRIAYFV